MIRTIMRNLITNGIKFTKSGGEISISSKLVNKLIEVTVSDTGIGIKKEDIKKLFRIDVNHSTVGTDQEMGTGLGLIICKEFAVKNGGDLWVESEYGKGSNFIFQLVMIYCHLTANAAITLCQQGGRYLHQWYTP